jgi:hypothetical protein
MTGIQVFEGDGIDRTSRPAFEDFTALAVISFRDLPSIGPLEVKVQRTLENQLRLLAIPPYVRKSYLEALNERFRDWQAKTIAAGTLDALDGLLGRLTLRVDGELTVYERVRPVANGINSFVVGI